VNITRRGFIGSSLAALLLPTIKVNNTVDRERLLSQFCDDSGRNQRFDMDRPFIAADRLAYATDSRIMCRTEIAAPDISGTGKPPPVIAAWHSYWRPDSAWVRDGLPAVADLKICTPFGVCPLCEGRRIVLPEFPNFDDRQVDATMSRLGYCIDDNSVGDESCPQCRGRDDYSGPALVDLCGAHVYYRYAKLMHTLPGVQFCRSEVEDVVLFRADEFEGIAMGVIRDA
jgi:hypothetical protein